MKRTLAPTLRAAFNLSDLDTPAPDMTTHARRLHASLKPGHIALITGPSGTGKSTLARALAALTPCIVADHDPRTLHAAPPRTPDLRRLCGEGPGPRAQELNALHNRSVIDLLSGPLPRRLSLLSTVGLADAHLFTRPASTLSVGQRARLSIALALDAAARTRRTTIILDEFCSTLDRPTAFLLSRLLRRALSHTTHLRLICLTAHDDLAPSLQPDLTLHVTQHLPPSHHSAHAEWGEGSGEGCLHPLPGPPGRGQGEGLASFDSRSLPIIEPATFADYTTLAHHHYRPTRPAILAGPHAIRRALDPHTRQLVGVLVLAMPTLNGPWRDTIWPHRYHTNNKPADAARLSAELRTIARVIVAPSHRGLGIATALVRHYLASPLTPATEAIAAMGIASPFFRAAGMTPYRLPPTPRDARLLDALAHLHLSPTALLDPPTPCHQPCHGVSPPKRADSVRSTRNSELAHPLLLRELRVWANRSRATRPLLTSPDPTALPRAAAAALLTPRLIYAHVDNSTLALPRTAAIPPHPTEPHHAQLPLAA